MGGRICRIVVRVYQALCALSLLFIALSTTGALGIESDPLAAVFAIVLALPWSLFLDQVAGDGGNVALNLALLAGGMVVNAVLFLALCRLAGRDE